MVKASARVAPILGVAKMVDQAYNCLNWMRKVKFGVETNVYQGFRLIYVRKIYNVFHITSIPARPQDGALFYPTRKGGKIEARRMTDQAVLDILRQRGKEANLTSFSPHDFRRMFISNLLDRGADIATVQKLAGHASPVTTARYDRRGEAAKRKAASLLHTPYAASRVTNIKDEA
jgi:integrase